VSRGITQEQVGQSADTIVAAGTIAAPAQAEVQARERHALVEQLEAQCADLSTKAKPRHRARQAYLPGSCLATQNRPNYMS